MVIISGPTGSGESTITRILLEHFSNFKRLVSATTRKPRLEEKDGVDYYFFSKEDFLKAIDEGNILEYTYIKNRDSYYGTYRIDLEEKMKAGFVVVVNVDGVGVDYYKRKYDAVAIFIKPASLNELRGRLQKRDPSMTEKELGNRIENARAEIENEEKFYDYIVYNENGKLEQAMAEVIGILQKENYELS